MENLVKVKNAYGNVDGLRHYNATLIELQDDGSYLIKPYYSASSIRAINQWFEAMGINCLFARERGNYRVFSIGYGEDNYDIKGVDNYDITESKSYILKRV